MKHEWLAQRRTAWTSSRSFSGDKSQSGSPSTSRIAYAENTVATVAGNEVTTTNGRIARPGMMTLTWLGR
jgi:hypothetical protein